jgi:hypothetical protein
MKKIILFLGLILLVSCGSKQLENNDVKIVQKNIIAINETGLFNNCDLLDDELLKINRFKTDTFEELTIYSSELANDPSLYIIALPVDDSEKDCIAQIDYYINNRLTAYLDYNPESAKMIESRLEETYGEYLIYIISTDNQLAYNTLIN